MTLTFVADVAFSVRDSRLMAIIAPGFVTMIDRASAGSLAILQIASISRAAPYTFHIFKMLVDHEFWPQTNIVRFADEFRLLPPPRDCCGKNRKNALTPDKRLELIEHLPAQGTAASLHFHGGTPAFSSCRINCAEQGEARFPGGCKPPSDTSRRDSWERITLPDSSSRAKREDHSASSRAA